MKTLKSFRLSEEAVAILEAQDNATQFIEDLVTGRIKSKGGITEAEALIVDKIDSLREFLELKGLSIYQQAAVTGERVTVPPLEVFEPAETPGTTMEEIKLTELERDEKLAFCQDPQEAKRISVDYGQALQKLWDKYHLLKNKP